MKLTYFGTAAAEGWPALYCNCDSCKTARKLKGKDIRTRCQALVNDDLLLDFPPDTYLHVLNYGLDLDKVTDIVVTHAHEDHLYVQDLANRQIGYCPVRAPHMLNLHGNERVKELFDDLHKLPYNESLETVVQMHVLEEYKPYKIANYTVYPMVADHSNLEKCFIYVIVDQDGKSLLYAHDTGYLKEEVWEFLKKFKLDLVSLDCNHGKLESERNHMGIECCAKVKQRLIDGGYTKPDTKFVVHHFSHNCKFLSHEEIEQAASKYGFLVSYDTMQVEV
ncbi:MBL fold metallo-hydrolase [Paludicola sp. MB14-C6]|uniref:MBL fold metallo-hydrolase n=1 Tax=Paludihabitans sp. MB14-C6 TaxID=3070656 RepID=UPI0027DD607A|nr:MBL fold metallo-hydrolase [Paludicola sp. MB14-C6]WMJ22485.1 MBL fold metallo-hydrolase [Paludicola sp. MB14-C6]